MFTVVILIGVIVVLLEILVWNGTLRREVIQMAEHNRMVRIGGGQNEGRLFFRIDLWWKGWRWTLTA